MIYVVCWLFIRDNVGNEEDTEEMPEDATEEVLEVYNDVQTKNQNQFCKLSVLETTES